MNFFSISINKNILCFYQSIQFPWGRPKFTHALFHFWFPSLIFWVKIQCFHIAKNLKS